MPQSKAQIKNELLIRLDSYISSFSKQEGRYFEGYVAACKTLKEAIESMDFDEDDVKSETPKKETPKKDNKKDKGSDGKVTYL
jgi:hypothetical protein